MGKENAERMRNGYDIKFDDETKKMAKVLKAESSSNTEMLYGLNFILFSCLTADTHKTFNWW